MEAYPGTESYRISREEVTKMDDLCLALSELCVALNFTSTFRVWDYTFCPKDYLGKHLENKITSGVNAIVKVFVLSHSYYSFAAFSSLPWSSDF